MAKKRTKEQQRKLREKRSKQRTRAQRRKKKCLEEMRSDNENKNSRAIDKRIKGFNGILDGPYMDLVRS